MYVCVDFFGGWVGFFLTGGGCVVPCSCTKDKNSINLLLLVLFAIQVQDTGHIFLLFVCIVALVIKKYTDVTYLVNLAFLKVCFYIFIYIFSIISKISEILILYSDI